MELQVKFYQFQKETQIQIDALQKQICTKQKQNQIIQQQNNMLKEQILKLQQIKQNSQKEIEKLTNFCKDFTQENDCEKRKQTLQWVDKFKDQLENGKKRQRATLEDIGNFVKNQANNLKQHLRQIMSEISKNQNELVFGKKQCEKSLPSLLHTLKQESEEILKQNEKFWNKVMKIDKQIQKNQQIANMQNEIQNLNQTHQKQIQQYKHLIKTYQSQKKKFASGYQQLRSLNQNRQKIYQQQINQLKLNIQLLIKIGTQKDLQFDQQIKTMTTQIQSINHQYYNNIQMPITKIKQKISEQLKQIKSQFYKIKSNHLLKNSLDNLQRIMNLYLQQNIKQKYTQQLLSNLYQLNKNFKLFMTCSKQHKLGGILEDKQNHNRHRLSQKSDEEEKDKQSSFKQQLNKDHFELVLTKKYLEKLKQHCDGLERNNGSIYVRQPEKDNNQYRKILELEAENEALRENIVYIKGQHEVEIYNIKLSKESQTNHLALMDKVRELVGKIQHYLKEQSQHFTEMKEHLKIMKNVLMKPIQSFEVVMKQISQINFPQVVRPISPSKVEKNNKNKSCFSFGDEVKAYKELITTKNDNYNNTKKLLGGFIKLLSESSLKQHKQKTSNIKKSQKNESKPQQNDQKIQFFEKKIKQIQSQRVKQKQQMISRIQKIQQNLHKIFQKIHEYTQLKTHIQKFQINLDHRINQIINRIPIIVDHDNVKLITFKDNILDDLKIKLSSVNQENLIFRSKMTMIFNQDKT